MECEGLHQKKVLISVLVKRKRQLVLTVGLPLPPPLPSPKNAQMSQGSPLRQNLAGRPHQLAKLFISRDCQDRPTE